MSAPVPHPGPHPSSAKPHASRREFLATAALAGTAGVAGSCRAPTGSTGSTESAERASALDERFAGLADQRARYSPITAAQRGARRARLGRTLTELGLDALLCESGPTMTHLSGVSWGRSERLFALIVLADGDSFWICPAFEESRAQRTIEDDGGPGGEIVLWDEHEYAWRPLAAALRERGVERIGIEPQARFFIGERLAREFGADRVVSGAQAVLRLRGRKEPEELALLRGASELTQRALGAVAEHLRPGMTGQDVSELVHAAQRKLGLTGTWALCLVGPAAAYPHGVKDVLALGAGDFVLVDTGGALHGYQSDTTRTWSVGGAPGERPARAWHAVRDAQQRAFDAIRPGVPCGAIDRIARESLERAGYGTGYTLFTHRLGHGIGLEGHEQPYFDSGSEVLLAPGMTLSNEPGLYFPGEFGVRLEDIVAVTADGAEHFGSWQAEPGSPRG